MKKFFASLGPEQNPYRGQPQIVVIGNFDGVHRGHRALLAEARNEGQKRGLPAVVVTFDPHPMAILRPPHLRLFDLEDQQNQIREAGLDGVVYLSFSRDFSELPAQAFLDQVLTPNFKPVVLVVGFNFRFGAGRSGDTETLKKWGALHGCEVRVVNPVQLPGGVVSTSEIRKAVQAGEVARAAEYLGRPYWVSGIVMHGEARGRGIGFPTANLHLEKMVIPAWGVFATRTWVGAKAYDSVTHLGPLPTFSDEVVRLETHLLDFQGDLYGKTVRVEFLDRIRGVQKFGGIQELRDQIQKDVNRAREILAAFK